MIVYFLLCFLAFGLTNCEEKWSIAEEESDFEPQYTVLENWTSVVERNEKIMKMSPTGTLHANLGFPRVLNQVPSDSPASTDRYIVTTPTKQPPFQSSKPNDVSETDLFLLGAIEKLAYRLDFLEKRLQRTEQMLYQVIAGSQNQFSEKVDSCPEHFIRFGANCFHVSTKQLNWKSASSTCRNLGATLVEFETQQDENLMKASLQLDLKYEGKDYWTGGLNPGLLWIWSSSAKPVQNNSSQSTGIKNIEGNGRCLLMAFQPPIKNYRFKGAECSLRNYFICQYQENTTGRRLERLQKALKLGNK